MKLQYVGNELKEKDTARPISEIKRSLDKLNQSVSAIQMPPSKQSLCVAISDCDALKRSILNFYDAQNESYDFNARANLFDIDIKSDVNVYKFTLSSRLPLARLIIIPGKILSNIIIMIFFLLAIKPLFLMLKIIQ